MKGGVPSTLTVMSLVLGSGAKIGIRLLLVVPWIGTHVGCDFCCWLSFIGTWTGWLRMECAGGLVALTRGIGSAVDTSERRWSEIELVVGSEE